MDIDKIFIEEDLFPKNITTYEIRDYGLLFYNDVNKDSYDSNHAIIYKEKIDNIKNVLDDVVDFYKQKNIKPCIYQSINEEGYFDEIKNELIDSGFDYWNEEQKYMLLAEKNIITPNPQIKVEKISKWDEQFAVEIFEKAKEPWEVDVAKKALLNDNTIFFVAYYNDCPVGMTYAHITNGVYRVDYLLVSKEYRNIGVGRTLIHSFVNYCHEREIETCYLWPDGKTAEKIYHEAGFKIIKITKAGRAIYSKN